MKAPSPLLGFNNNVRHKGRVFHIQTEDSGIRHPHIITHLFADGGRILKTTKTSYAEHIGQEKLNDVVRAMMQEQHKSMFIALRDGQFDHLFEEGASSQPKPSRPGTSAPPEHAPSPAPPPAKPARAVSTPPPPRAVSTPPPPRAASSPPPPRAASTPPPRVASAPPPPVAEVAPPSRKRSNPRPRLEVDAAAIHGVAAAPAHGARRDEPAIDHDLDALERAAAEAQTPFFHQIQDLPPPPAAVLGKRGGAGGYSVRGPSAAPPPMPSSAPRASSSSHRPSSAPPQASGRYAPSRPASIFATTRPQEGTSIFGEDLISEKSLDEVILSYLSEDLDGPGEKK